MKKLLLLIFILVLVLTGCAKGKSNMAIDWDLLDEDCSDISDWIDIDQPPAVSEVSPAGQFRFDTNEGAAGNDMSSRKRDIGSFPNLFTIEVKLYHDNIGLFADADYFCLDCRQADEFILMAFETLKLYIYDTDSGYTEVGTDLVKSNGSAEWQTWRVLVTFTETTGEGTCDVYLNDSTHNWEKVGTAIPCSMEGKWGDGEIHFRQYGNTTDDMVTHVDWIKIATSLHPPTKRKKKQPKISLELLEELMGEENGG